MSQQTSPFIEAAYGWNFGENNWNGGMDENMLKFSYLFDRNVDGVVSSLPAVSNGSAYFLTTDNRLYFGVGSSWYSTSTPKWFEFKIRTTGEVYQFNGTSATSIGSLADLDSRLDAVELTLASIDNIYTDLAANSGASLVGYKHPAAGSVARTAQAVFRESVSVKDFGAVGDGTTDDTAAFNAAIAYANTIGGNDFLNITGITVNIPQGRYKITSALTTITKSGIDVKGAGWDATVLLLPVGVFGVFKWGDAGVTGFPVGGSLTDMKLEYLTTPNTNTCVVQVSRASRLLFDNLLIANIGMLLSLGTSASDIASGIFVSNVAGSCANIGNIPVFDVRYGAGFTLNNLGIFAPVPVPLVGQPSLTELNRNVFNLAVGFWDTIQVSNSIFERFDSGFAINSASGMVYQNIFIDNTIFDLHKTSGISASSASGGVVAGIRSRNSWITTWDGPAIIFTGVGTHFEHDLDFYVPIAGMEALFYGLTAGRNNKFRLSIGSVNRVATASNAAMHFVTTTRGFSLNECSGNDDNTGIIYPWRAQHGISIGADCLDYSVSNCKVTGSADSYFTPVNSTQSLTRRIANNSNANYATVSSFALNASTVPTFNKTAFVMDVDINGGTVTAIAKDGTTITGKTSGIVRLDPGQSVTWTGTVAPSATAIIHA